MRAITDLDAFTEPVNVLVDGDPVAETSTDQTIQALANRTRNLKNRIDSIVAALNTYSANSHRKGFANGIVGIGASGEVSVSSSITSAAALSSTATGASAFALQGVASGAGSVAVYASQSSSSGFGSIIESAGVGLAVLTSGAGYGVSIDTKTSGSGRAIYADGGLASYISGVGTGSGATHDALELQQNLLMSGSIPAASTLMGKRLTAGNMCRAWGNVTCGGASAPTVNDGYSFTASRVSNSTVRITIPAMSNDDYCVTFGQEIFGGAAYHPVIVAKTTSTFDVRIALTSDGSLVGDVGNINFNFNVFGRS